MFCPPSCSAFVSLLLGNKMKPPTRNRIVVFSLDDVLYPFNSTAREANQRNSSHCPGYQVRHTAEVIEGLPLMQGAKEVLELLQKSSDVFIAVSPGGPDGKRAAAVVRLVGKTLGTDWVKKLLITDNVAHIAADVLVDARKDPAEVSPVHMVEPVWRHLHFKRSWNEGPVDWSNMLAFVESVPVKPFPLELPRLPTVRGKRILLIDQDNTFTNFNRQCFDIAREVHGLQPLSSSPRSARVVDDFAKGDADILKSIYQGEGFIRDLKDIPDAVRTIKELAKTYSVLFVTAPPTSDHAASEKVAWVAEHFGREWVSRMVITEQKTLIMGDVLIDDAPRPLGTRSLAPYWTHFAFEQPWNDSNDRRINWGNAAGLLSAFFFDH